MHSYIDIYNLAPRPHYYNSNELAVLIDDRLFEQNVKSTLREDKFSTFRNNIISCMKIYYQLVGIDESVISSSGVVTPNGILPKFTKSLISYFHNLENNSAVNKEIETLRYSGLTTIKIRYKNIDSVVKKIIKLGLRDPDIFQNPLKIFLNGGALHDLVGILFVCSYPYEKEWIARSLYNFFEYKHRADDHLVYGFYTVKKKSGYQGLHCDNAIFNPRFDPYFCDNPQTVPLDPKSIFDMIGEDDVEYDVLHKLKDYFNIEIQIHTTFENLWATMEHSKSYNIHAKGRGRNSEITVQWKLLSDAMHNLEQQFERLQIDTEQAQFKSATRKGYTFINDILNKIDPQLHNIYRDSSSKIYNLDNLLRSHEISRQSYVQQLYEVAEHTYRFAYEQKNLSVRAIFLLHSAYIYYSLTTYHEYFNHEDIQKFVIKAKDLYSEIHYFLNEYPDIYKSNLLNLVATIRYLYLEHKHYLGLIFANGDEYEKKLSLFRRGIDMINRLNDEDLCYLKKDNASYLKIVHSFDLLAREWELFPTYDDESILISESIREFRAYFINMSLELHFKMLLDSDKITNVGLVVKFYIALIWHGIIAPLDGLKQIIKYSSYDKIEVSDLFYYELAAYRFLMMCCREDSNNYCSDTLFKESDPVRIKHLQNYHKENMIQQLFRIKRDESAPEFEKARLNFEQLTGERFKIDYFSGHLPKV